MQGHNEDQQDQQGQTQPHFHATTEIELLPVDEYLARCTTFLQQRLAHLTRHQYAAIVRNFPILRAIECELDAYALLGDQGQVRDLGRLWAKTWISAAKRSVKS